MKIKISKRLPQEASVLAVALVTAGILSLTIWSYLLMIQNQNLSVVRSQAWNGSLAVAEAGIEEALAQLNPGVTAADVDRAGNGWGYPSNGLYGPLTRTLSSGTYAVSYTTDSFPIIYSSGSAAVPVNSTTLSRVIRVTTAIVPLFNVALGAVGSISMNGNGVATDSFDSSSTNLSTNGQYDSSKTSTNGNVASLSGVVDIGNHSIDGNLYLGPTATFSGTSGQVSGAVYNDFNVNFPDVILPTLPFPTSLGLLPSLAPDGQLYNHVFTSPGNYTISDTGSIYVGTNAAVIVKVTAASWSPSVIHIAGSPTNSGQLTVYMTGASSSLSGNSSVDSGVAANFTYYGMPNNTSITYSGTSSFVGTIYAPEVDLTLNGGGNNIGLVGASVTKTVTMNGHYNFHFDQALLKKGPTRGYSATSWTEL